MSTNIDTGLTVSAAVSAAHSPHIFTMSNGDLLTIYYNGTNLVWRSKSGGAWSAATTIALDTGVTPPQVSYWTRNGDVIYGGASKDPIDASHNADFFELTYTPATHTLATTNKQVDAADGSEKIAGYASMSGAGTNDKLAALHGNAAGNFGTIQELNVNPTIVGVDQSPTFGDFRSTARTGLVSDGTTTTYLMYACAATGTAFKVERFVAGTNADNVEAPPAPAANPVGITGVYDGTHYVFLINENNAKLRFLTRTGTNTYGSWTDILSDAGLTGEPTVCVKANGDLAVFYRTTTAQANGEIWVVARIGGVWGTGQLLAGGAATGWNTPSCAASDLNDSGIARLIYVTGTASTWTLVEDSFTIAATGGGSSSTWTGTDSLTLSDSAAFVASASPNADTVSLADTPSPTGQQAPPADSVTLAETTTASSQLAPTDALTLVDSQSAALTTTNVADILTLADVSGVTGQAAPTADTLPVSDAATASGQYAPVDSVVVVDVPGAAATTHAPVDSLTLVDAQATSGLYGPTDAVALSDTTSTAASTTFPAETVVLAEVPGGSGRPAYTESVALSETVSATGGMVPSDVLTLAEAPSAVATASVSDPALTLSDTGVFVPGGSVSFWTGTDALTLADSGALVGQVFPLADVMVVSDAPAGSGAAAYVETLTIVEVAEATSQHAPAADGLVLAESGTSVGAIAPVDILTLAESIAASASAVVGDPPLALVDAMGGTGEYGPPADALVLREQVRAVAGLAPTEALTLLDMAAWLAATAYVADTLTLAESGVFAAMILTIFTASSLVVRDGKLTLLARHGVQPLTARNGSATIRTH